MVGAGGRVYRDSELSGYSTEANKLLADGHPERGAAQPRFSATDVPARVEVLGKFRTGTLAHEVLAGVDAYHFDDHRVQLRSNPSAGNPYAIDIYAPVYGGKAAPLALSIDTQEGQRAACSNAQDQIDLDAQWKALVGVRRDTYTQDVTNHRLNTSNRQSLSATSPRAGLDTTSRRKCGRCMRVRPRVSGPTAASASITRLSRERSRAYELGAKLETGKLTGTLAVYGVRKTCADHQSRQHGFCHRGGRGVDGKGPGAGRVGRSGARLARLGRVCLYGRQRHARRHYDSDGQPLDPSDQVLGGSRSWF